ncbi:MAG: metallopeptidase family protein [Planctomycetota bacterium]|nr:metallopeptidase family protein [Planctomycetota bacterium]
MNVFDEIAELDSVGDPEGVERTALAALEAGVEPEDKADLWWHVARARLDLARWRHAADAAKEAGSALLEAIAYFHDWAFEEAREAAARPEAAEEDEAEAAWYRGLAAEFTDGDPAAHFARAAELDPERFHEAVPISDEDADVVVQEALGRLPEDIRTQLEGAVIEVHDYPRKYPDVDPLTLGLYVGLDRMERGFEDSGNLPSRIEIYRKNIARVARDREEAVEELRITLLHEVGHHLGFDELGLDSLGLG